MTLLGIPNEYEGNGLVLRPDERLEALAWSLSECASMCDLNDLRAGAPFRALLRRGGTVAQDAARLLSRRYHEIDAEDRARAAQHAASMRPGATGISEAAKD